eukprot:1891793-Rhodomonas_salina.1
MQGGWVQYEPRTFGMWIDPVISAMAYARLTCAMRGTDNVRGQRADTLRACGHGDTARENPEILLPRVPEARDPGEKRHGR